MRLDSLNWRRAFASAYLRSAGWYLGLKLVIFTLAGLASQYLLANYLSRSDFGLLIWVGTIIALLGPFGLPGISTSITGAVAKGYDGNFVRGTWLELAGGTLGGLVLLGFSSYYWFWTYEETKALIFVVAGVLGPGLWLDTQLCYWNGKKNFRALFWWSVPVRLAQLAAMVAVLQYSSNPIVVFGSQTVIQVTANIGASLGILRSKSTNREISKEYEKFGWFSTNLYWVGTVAAYLDKVIIGAFFGLEALASFAVGELLYTYFYKTPGSFLSQIFLPRQAEMGLREAARWTKRRQGYLVGGVTAILIVVGVAVPVLYPVLFSNRYNDSILFAELFLVCILLGSPTLLVGSLLKAHALVRETKVAWTIMCIGPLVLIPPLAWLFGLKGVILARGATNALVSIFYFHVLRKLQKI